MFPSAPTGSPGLCKVALFHGTGIIDWFVEKATPRPPGSIGLSYSHVEFVFSNGIAVSTHPTGIVFRIIPDLNYTTRWTLVPIQATAAQEDAARDFCEALIAQHTGYGWREDIDLVLSFPHEACEPNCSNLVRMILQRAFGMLPAVQYSVDPNDLANLLLGAEPVSGEPHQ